MDRPKITISVRNLVEFILRSGDIDNRRKSAADPAIMQEGANIHRMIQKRMGSSYHAEYFLCHRISRGDYDIVVEGRADGIILPIFSEMDGIEEDNTSIMIDKVNDVRELEGEDISLGLIEIKEKRANDPDSIVEISAGEYGKTEEKGSLVIVDEIKTTYQELEYIKAPKEVHLAQAKCYAYMYAAENNLNRIGVRMTYCNIDTKEIRYFNEVYSRLEISEWFEDLIEKYSRWSDFEFHFKQLRNDSIEALSFPYEFREGQKELIAQIYNSIVNKEKLFCMAPTGVGKTLATVYPSIKAMGMDKCEKIFYLTAKTITRSVAENCLNILRERSLKLKSVTLTAKEKICPMDECDCNPEGCAFAKGHYDRINDALFDMVVNEDNYSREKVLEYADRHKVCPFEMSLDASLFADVIIGDYNYVYDPNVYLKRFFADGAAGKYFFLTDEAHNLVERAMKMYSAELFKEQFLEVRRIVKGMDAKLSGNLETCNKYLLEEKRSCEGVKVVESFDTFIMMLHRLTSRFEIFLDDHDGKFEGKDTVLDLYFDVLHFQNMYENMGADDYVQYMQQFNDGSFMVRLLCANPAASLERCAKRAQFNIYFSATLVPIDYYKNLLGGDKDDKAVYAKSVFDPDKRGLFIARDVTSKYSRRCDDEYEKMAEYIYKTVSAKHGNYMVFAPSHAMLSEVYDAYMRLFMDDSQEIILQSVSMSEEERESFLKRFSTDTDTDFAGSLMDSVVKSTLIGFCVLGGIFAEGIDLKNDDLIGAIIIGTGLPMVCNERELLKTRYSDEGVDGFAYAYRYPGMNKVLQAAGRVIRTVDDKGVVVLLDDRFLSSEYMRMFPREWGNYQSCTLNDYSDKVSEFWKKRS